MIDAGRFTTVGRKQFCEDQNQQIKDHWGSNYVYGDIILEIFLGDCILDYLINRTNIIAFIQQLRNPTKEMVKKYFGEQTDHLDLLGSVTIFTIAVALLI